MTHDLPVSSVRRSRRDVDTFSDDRDWPVSAARRSRDVDTFSNERDWPVSAARRSRRDAGTSVNARELPASSGCRS
jgi:hypothetical protein